MTKCALPKSYIIAFAVLFAGCSTQHEILRKEQSKFLETLDGRTAEVLTSDGKTSSGSDFSIRNDSLIWMSDDENASRSLALSEINAIITKDRVLGGIKGFLLGVVGGTMAMFITAKIYSGPEFEGVLEGIIVGSVVAVGGTTAGIIIGHPHEYVFVRDSVGVKKSRSNGL
jgi:hypothetical protein